jgi:hypothetical protein
MEASLWAILLTAGCGPVDSAAPAAADVASLDGLPRWSVVEQVRIGGRTPGGAPRSFVAAGPIAVGADGRIYVGQWQTGEVGVFDSTGVFQKTIRASRPSSAEPAVFNIGWLGDTLYVADMSRVVSYFSPDGEPRGTTTIVGRAIPGTLYSTGMAAPLALPAEYTVQEASQVRQTVVELSRDGRTAEPLAEVTLLLPALTGQSAGKPVSIAAPQPYRDHALRFVTGDGTVYYDVERAAAREPGPAELEVRSHTRAGAETWARTYRYTPVATIPQVVDSAVSETLARMGASGLGAGVGTALRALVYLPPFQPPIRSVRADATGLWLQRELALGEERWDRIDANGEAVARLSLPAGITPALITEDRVFAWSPDANGVLAVVGYRIRKEAR